MGIFAIFILITLALSAFIGWLFLISTKPNSNIQKKEETFVNSTIWGLLSGLIGGLIGHYLGSKSASNVDELFGGLSAIGAVTNYFKVFLPCWIISTLGGAALGINFLDLDRYWVQRHQITFRLKKVIVLSNLDIRRNI